MHKWLVSLSIIVATGIFALPAISSAHVLKVDGNIGAVLHINPDDNPTSGTPTSYVLSFDDDADRFNLQKCNCRITLVEQGSTVSAKPLAATSGEVSSDTITFPKPAVYTMRFTGAPKQPGAFQPFTLNYEVRVTDGKASMQAMPMLLWVGMGLVVGLILLAAYAMDGDTNE